MKKYLFILLIIAVAAMPRAAVAQGEAGEPLRFTILIVGTRHFADVDVIGANIRKIPLVRDFTQKISSQNHIEFSGAYSGERESLIDDIKGLAADRYNVQAKDFRDRGLVITLRKMADDSK